MAERELETVILSEPRKIQAIRNMEYHDFLETSDMLYEKSLNGEIPRRLMKYVTDRNNIRLAYRNLKTNKGSSTPGVDGKTMKDLANEYSEDELVFEVRKALNGIYKPKEVKRVMIPKPGSDKMRPLGIPCCFDRLIQQCLRQVLEPICEAQFYKHNFGFRPERSCENAIARCYYLAQVCDLHYVVDVDIKGFFDNVDHSKLLKQLWTLGIRDKKILSLIRAMLKATIIMPDGEPVEPKKGTPQGGIISPLLANVVLNELDHWVAGQWEEFPAKRQDGEDYACSSSFYAALKKTGLKEIRIVRYADDFKIFVATPEDAIKVKAAIEEWLMERLKLETAPEKSKITDLKREYSEFLGIKFKLHKKGDKYVIVSHMTDKAKNKVKANLKGYIKEIQHPSDGKELYQRINNYNAAVMGVHEYYCMATHISEDMREIAYETNRCLYNRVLKDVKNPKEGELNPESAVAQKYGESEQMRYVNNKPIAPIGYARFKMPFQFNQEINRFTEAGREILHSILGVSLVQLMILMGMEVHDRSIEYYDNRISKYCAQFGRCAITGAFLNAHEIHCHHIIPLSRGDPDDSYSNLLIVSEDIHILIHAKEVDIIMKYLPLIEDEKQLKKLNKYRILAGREPIANLVQYGIQLSFLDRV